MSTIDNPQPQPEMPPPAPDELVAYLDGELSPEECRQVEERLASDVDYRQQLRDLDQAWEALDALPATSVADDFARTTIEMVALAAQQEQKDRSTEVAATRRNRRRMWAIVGATAALLSFAAARLLLPDTNARLLGDLPVITQMDLLAQIQDIDFLQRLAKEVPLEQMVADESAVEREVKDLQAASDRSPEVRRQWIESLPSEQRADLAAQAKQFEVLPNEERDRLNNLEQQISTASDRDQLQRTLSTYGLWLNRRTNGEQSNLRSMATDDRIRRIRETIRQDGERAARRLSPDDAKQLREVILKIYDDRKDEFSKAMRRRDRDDRPRRLEGRPDEMALFVASWALGNNDIDDKTRERMVGELTPEAQEHLDKLRRRGGERAIKVQLWQWMRDAMKPTRKPGDLERFFAEELKDDEREHLLSLRKDEMEAELERMYLGSRFGLHGLEWLGNFGEPGRGPGPGRPGWRPDGPPPELGGPQGPPPPDGPEGDRFDPDRRGPGPDGPDDRRGRRPPPDGPPPPEPGEEQPI